ncbi:MAG: TonB-dependent receptor [Burkholderiales bacterium]|nr:TonB-dependent receptor [Burkholderiales bacterium]MDP2396781.1 TonB-dependent receptor [Burkholderiales bacterium]
MYRCGCGAGPDFSCVSAYGRRTLRVAGAAFTALALVVPARAQETVTLPEVSVSATRVERESLDLPVSIDVIDRRTIREAGPQVNLSEALGRVPGIAVQNRQNYAQDLQISSRGFGARAAFGVRGIRLIADGIPATMPDGQGQAANFSLSSAQRIEVMRGPFSSLHGNAAGGVVQIFTAEAPPEPTFMVDASLGSYRSARLGLQYGGRHGPLGLRLEAARFETGGYRDHSSARRDTSNARISYDRGRAGRLTVVLNSLDQPETEDPLGLTAAQLAQNPRQAVAAAYVFNTRKSIAQGQAGFTYDIDLGGGHALQARTYIGDRRVTQYLAIPLAVQAVPTHSGGVVDLDRSYGGLGLRWSHEGQLAGRRAAFSVGVDHDRMAERRRGFINNMGSSGALKRDEDNRVENADVYAQAEWQALPRLGLLAGLRHSRVRFESQDYFIAAGNADDSGAVDYVRTTPALGASFRVSPRLNVYANAGRGFETPTFVELAYRPGAAAGLNFALKPSTSLHRELGIKALTGDHGQLNAALFRIDTRDEIVVNSAAGGRSDFRNASGTRRKGLELAWQQRHAGGFESALAWTLLDASFRQPFVSGTPPLVVAAGNRLPGVAARQFYGELLWRDAASGFHAGVELRHVGKVYVNDRNSESAAAYTIGNLRAGFMQRGRGWRFSQFLRVDNVADRGYVGSVIVADGNGRYYEPAPGRAVTLSATLEFRY